jgi:inosine triphosphate pyrophosphatase
MAYAMLSTYGKSGRSLSAAAAILRGFNSVHPLEKVERELLVLFVACRLACSVTLGAYSYKQNPENKYLLLHAEPAWNALDLIWGTNLDERARVHAAMNALFDLACYRATSVEEKDIPYCSDLAIPDQFALDWLISVKDRGNCVENGKPPKRPKVSDLPVITFVTGNQKKLEEVKRILLNKSGEAGDSLSFSLTNAEINLPELQGDPITIAKKKCELAAREMNGAVITEDTSLCFSALNELPGPYIKRFLDKCGHVGLNKMIEGFEDKSAYASTVVAFCAGPNKKIFLFEGRTEGQIVMPRGKLDFGWDPVFEPIESNGKTYAEMSKDEKDSISHRSRAFAKLREYLMQEKESLIS